MLTVFAFLVTFAIHSTIILLVVRALTRGVAFAPRAEEWLWRGGLLLAPVTTAFQLLAAERFGGWSQLFVSDGASRISLPAPGAGPVGKGAESLAALSPDPFVVGWSDALVIAWAVTVAALLARNVWLASRWSRALLDRRMIVDGPLADALDRVLRRLPAAPAVRLSAYSGLSSPVVLRGGEICVPTPAASLDPSEQEALLAHEFAHVTRRDGVAFGAYRLITSFAFFQPLVPRAVDRLFHLAELDCDARAADALGDGHPLARCLAHVGDWIVERRAHALPALTGSPRAGALFDRVSRLVDRSPESGRSYRVAIPALLALAFVVGVGGPSVLPATTLVASNDRAEWTYDPASPRPSSSRDPITTEPPTRRPDANVADRHARFHADARAHHAANVQRSRIIMESMQAEQRAQFDEFWRHVEEQQRRTFGAAPLVPWATPPPD